MKKAVSRKSMGRTHCLAGGAVISALFFVAGVARAETGIEAYEKAVAAEKDLVACWRFQGDLQDSKGKLDGLARAGEPQFCEGPAGGRALMLRNGRFVTMGNTPELDLAETTVEFWFRPVFARGAPAHNPCILAKRGPGAQATRFSVHIMQAYSDIAVWNGSAVMLYPSADPKLEPEHWYHVAITCSRDGMKAYLDGAPFGPAQSSCVFNSGLANMPFSVGASSPDGTELLDGDVAEVAIYGRALSEAEIARHVDAAGKPWADRRMELVKTRKELAGKDEQLLAARAAKVAKSLEDRLSAPVLVARGEPFVCSNQYLDAISLPVGGIGAGVIQMNGKAEPAIWQIFNNGNNVRVPNSFLAVRAGTTGGKSVVRAMQTAAVGPFAAMESLSFEGAYPFGWYTFRDREMPVKLSLETFSPLVPLDERNSALPCAVFNVTAENTTGRPIEVSFLACQQNAVGYPADRAISDNKHPGYGGNTTEVVRDKNATLLHMTSAGPTNAAGWGDMVLMAFAEKATVSADWAGLDKLAAVFETEGALPGPDKAGPSPAGETINGALAVSLKIPAGRKVTVSFVLVWYFPNGPGNWSGPGGNKYANWWPDALGLARELEEELPELSRRTHLYHDTLYESNLPFWLLDRISSQVAVLRSRTCFWTKNGYLGGWEGCNPGGGCCQGNCNHVWHYAQVHGRLFPAIARQLREQEFRFQKPDGGVPHRQPGEFPAFDGQCGAVLNSYREHLMSSDRKWLDKNWPGISNAMNYAIATWDRDEDGVLAGAQWNTLDGALGGNSSWLGSLYLAALGAAEKMALLENDADAAKRYARIRASGSGRQDATLFNGEYYIQIPDQEPRQDYGNGCHIDQVLGQWWAHQLDLGWVYPAGHVRAALASLLKYNFRTDFSGVEQSPRKFVAVGDTGMQMITWPKGRGPRDTMMYASEVMSGFEYSAATAMIQAGMLREGLLVAHGTWERYDGRLRSGLSGGDCTSWGFSGNPFGDDECGKFYARAMSSWSLLLACQGYVYDGPAGVIGFRPVWRPEDHASLFTAAEGWGLFTQRRSGRKQTEQIKVVEGRLRITAMVFQLPPDAAAGSVKVRFAGRKAEAKSEIAGGDLRLTLDKPVTVVPGSDLEVTIGM